ncbi:hypothetical protein ACFSBZ_11185 [Amnibacterium flavum]|uniref:hypothetical protein n=1 Tax=Amnibacterium flavum TaxID=2173173 RepID=UPI0010583148|nr:hypothetical protein [Amnibacterium flavum]
MYDDIFAVWASMAGLSPSAASPETIVGWGGADVAYEIRPAGARFAVVKVERSASVVGTFSDLTSAACLLILLIGRIWRSQERLPRAEAAEPAPETEIDAGPVSTDLRWAGGDAEFAPGRPGRFMATDVSHLVWRTPQEITTALLMPDASGLFADRRVE